MNKIYRGIIFFLLTSAHITHAQYGQPQGIGNGWLRLQQQFIQSDKIWDAAEEKVPIRTNSLFQTVLTGEYGFTDRITGAIYLPVFSRTTLNELRFNQSGNVSEGRAINSLGDADVSVRYLLLKKGSLQAQLSATLGLPLGKKDEVGEETDLQNGDGEFNQLAGLHVQYGVLPDRLVAQAYVQYNFRSEQFSDEVRYGATITFHAKAFSLMGRLDILESRFNDVAPVSINGIYSNHREFVAPGFEAWYHLNKILSVYGSGQFYVAGRNTLSAPQWGVGVQVSLRRR